MFDLLGILAVTALALVFLFRRQLRTLWRDVYTIQLGYRIHKAVTAAIRSNTLVIDLFEGQVRRRPQQPFIRFKDDVYTYADAEVQACRVARALMDVGVGAGDNVAVVMSNEPAFVWLYLGVQKIGAKIALVNHHLRYDSLRYSITSTFPKIVIVGDGLDDYLPGQVSRLVPPLDRPVYSYNKSDSYPSFAVTMTQVSDAPIDPAIRATVRMSDPSAFIFTSGTTGLPKPAIITHRKALLLSCSYGPSGFSERDVMYLTLPLYHSSALNLALLNVINVGATMFLREKFSATHFWSDCSKYKVTTFQYMGEMLRYLVNTPPKPSEKTHGVTTAVGNGLRADVWKEFQARFKVPRIFEFYGSTELPATVTNFFNIPGSVGRLSPLLSRVTHMILVDLDQEVKKPFRDETGMCVLTGPGGYGVLLAKLSDKRTFDGYLGSPSITNSRIIKDVLEVGDFYVNTDDVFTIDDEYNLYFKERIGDGFRWKGENVSAAEVTNVLNSVDYVLGTNVFGVEVPGCEGKAGMVAINLKDSETLDDSKIQELGCLCREKLPSYARPRFIRFQHQMSLTSTFKQEKTVLAREGFDPQVVQEPLYYLDRTNDEYKELDDEVYSEIVSGQIAL